MACTKFIRASLFVIVIILFAFSTASVAQNQSEKFSVDYPQKTPLLVVLNDLIALNICLNFDHGLVKDLKVSGRCDSCTVEEILDKFLKGTGLTWKKTGKCQFTIYEQANGAIKGKVIDADTKESLPGANVLIRGTSRGAATNSIGEFTIKDLQQGEYVLDVRLIGYQSKSIAVIIKAGEVANDSAELSPAMIELGEIEVISDQSRISTATNSVITIDAQQIQDRPIDNITDVIRGLVPGVNVLPSGGLVGQAASIRMRGSGLLTQINQPLGYVDGFLVSSMEDVNPAIIERIEILRGISAVTLYGSIASTGVVQITTKKNEIGRPRLSFKIEQSVFKYPDVYEPNVGFARDEEQAKRMSEAFGFEVRPFELVSRPFAKNLLGTGFGQTYSLSVAGGGSKFKYTVNGRFHRIDGPFKAQRQDFAIEPNFKVLDLEIKNDGISRPEFTANFTYSPFDKLTVFINSGMRSLHQELPINSFTVDYPMQAALLGRPELVTPQNPFGTPWGYPLYPGSLRQGRSSFFNGAIRFDLSDEINWEGQLGFNKPNFEITEKRFFYSTLTQEATSTQAKDSLKARTVDLQRFSFG